MFIKITIILLMLSANTQLQVCLHIPMGKKLIPILITYC